MSTSHGVAVMDQLAEQTWHLLRQCHDHKIRLDEDAITTQLLLALVMQLKGTLLMQDGRKDESQTGCDFELWAPNTGRGWRRYAIQAKRITVKTASYSKIKHRVGKTGPWQHDLLRKYSTANRAEPLYLLYSHWDPALQPGTRLKYAKTASTDSKLGCMVASRHTAEISMGKRGARNFPWFDRQTDTCRWSSLLEPPTITGKVPPAIAAAVSASAGGSGGAGGIDVDAIDGSNVHAVLPLELRERLLVGDSPRILKLREGEGYDAKVGLAPRAVLVLE